MKIAVAQINPTIGDLVNNAKKILAVANNAAKKGVRLLLTPELSLCGYPPRDLLLYPGFVESMQQQLEAIAQQLPKGMAALVGTVEANPSATSKGQKPLFNSMALLDEGKVQHIFHKRLLPSYDVFDEDRYFQSGYETNYFALSHQNAVASDLDDSFSEESSLKIGVTICEDLWNDEQFWGKRNYEVNPIEDLAYLGVDVVVNLSASPYSVGKQKLREAILHHAATKYKLPIIYVNQVGANDDLIFDGNSVVFNRQGEIVSHAKGFESDLVIVEFDPIQQNLSALTPINKQGVILDENEEIFAALVLGVKDYAHKCNFSQVILGLSGGIDSSLVAAIATEAMGADRVLGVLMPSPYSSDHSITDAVALAKNLGIRYEQFPIQEAMSAYDQILAPLFTGTEFGIAEENIQSRIRGNLLMAIANKFGYLLLSTGNKSEMAVGYCTLYGDMNGGLAVIADVPKTRVYSLCRWLNRHQEIIPNHAINKPPSAELKPGQLDQDSLPPYEILDDILDRLICQHQSEPEIIQSGHHSEVVHQVIKLVARAEFKRRQAPPGLKITDRAFGTGWRMPIASRWLVN
ncbi:NH(3)-dependent NAD(+) synthetase [Stanieria cyanosphaera PCC 7437]|uniref:Glutamine-dependent NAD(+) synthetase n=1 Tax=Stanieria cyanosphaera (strain ATCC 29371 / PCC 7437) TaxID=111780 RepID=K9XYB7_STAC7|nr:NAD+ synthase [Stanieria cyanosphaera]AFZ37528.1 NH(3)-dependent NAD(+) synthetase [Stanieria cyanosphaera PCC 7437]